MKETIDIELVTRNFTQKLNSLKTKINQFRKTAKQSFHFSASINMKEFISSMDSLNNYFHSFSNHKIEIDMDLNSNETINTAKQETELLNQSFTSLSEKSKVAMSKVSETVKNNLGNGLTSVKQFMSSIIGIQSIGDNISKASSAYLSQDVELSNKMQAIWVGLGSFLAPLMNSVANFFLKLVGYINVFISALSGKNHLADAMDKSTKSTTKTNKAVKDLKGQLSGIDEITNIGGVESSDNEIESLNTSGPDTSWADAFNDIKLNDSWVTTITNFGNWIKDNWQFVVVGITGIALALGSLSLASTLSSLGLTIALKPLLGIVLGITGLVALVLGAIELFKEGGDQTKAWTLILGGLAAVVIGVGLAFGLVPMIIALVVAAVVAGVLWIIKNWEDVKIAIDNGIQAIKEFFVNGFNFLKDLVLNFPNFLKEKFGVLGELIAQPFENGINIIKGVWEGVKQFFSGIKDFFVGIFTLDKDKTISGLKQMLSGMANIMISFIEGALNAFLIPINSAIKLINKIPGVNIPLLVVSIPRFNSFDVGTNYVPNDQLAYVHKGEAIVPKKFNSDEYFERGNEKTNELLKELIEIVENKEVNTYLDGNEIGKVARKYIVSQNRIMGRSTI